MEGLIVWTRVVFGDMSRVVIKFIGSHTAHFHRAKFRKNNCTCLYKLKKGYIFYIGE